MMDPPGTMFGREISKTLKKQQNLTFTEDSLKSVYDEMFSF